MSFAHGELFSTCGIRNAGGVIYGACADPLSARAILHSSYFFTVSFQCKKDGAGCEVQNPPDLVGSAGHDVVPVRAEADAIQRCIVLEYLEDISFFGGIP